MSGDALLPCPFCGGSAELDTSQSFRAISTGNLEQSAAIYCTECTVQMQHCYSDHRGTPRDDLILDLTENWNKRAAALTAPDAVPIRLRAIFPDGLVQFVPAETKPGYLEGLGCTVTPIYTEEQLAAEIKANSRRYPDTAPDAGKCGSCGEAIKPDLLTGTTCACVAAPDAGRDGWVFYYADDEGKPFATYCACRGSLYLAAAEWMTGDRYGTSESDSGDDMIEGVVDALIERGEFHPEGDPPCYAAMLAARPQEDEG